MLVTLFQLSSTRAEVVDVANNYNVDSLITSSFVYFEDASASTKAQDIIDNPLDYQWIKIKQPSTSFGFTRSAYWLKAELVNNSTSAKEFYLDIANPKVSLAELFLVDESNATPQILSSISISSNDSIKSRIIPHRHPIFPITLEAGQHQVAYLHLKNEFAFTVPVHLWKPESFNANDNLYLILQGGYFGCMLAMLIYNLFIFLSTRDRSFLYYVLFISSLVFFSIIDRGFGNEYLWHDSGDWSFRLYTAFVAVSVALATGFGRVYLLVSKYSPRFDLSLKVMESISWVLVFWALAFPSIEAIMITIVAMLLSGTLVIMSALYVLKQGQVLAKFYLLAWTVIIVGGITHVFGNFGIIPFSHLTEHMLQLSNVFEAMLLSFGLGYRINLLKQEREQARIETITERQNTLKEQEMNQAKTQFFASMSHEFRTPLTAILGYSELSKGDQVSAEEKDRNIKTINQSALYMLQLINDTLDLSKIESQKMDIELLPVDVFELVTDVHKLIHVLANNKNIYFRTECDYPIPKTVQTDPTRLKQALINLCSNAIKFTQVGGVTLRVSYLDSSNTIQFSVIDTGIGIKSDALDQLFTAFSQADSSTTRNFGGTGLGLYLSKIIANRLGGDIFVKSKLGEGSTFSVTVGAGELQDGEWIEGEVCVEATDEIACRKTESPPLKNSDGENMNYKKHILVVDDNLVNIKLLEFHLKKLGVTALCVNDGLEAIAHLLIDSFDLVLMDIHMPVMDGITAVKLLREKQINLPIYALTGSVDETSIKEFLSSGFTGYLPKPYDLEKIKACILDP
ncbi:MAG: response regulator [Pseudomonadales bacterium]|nr:response regulator [Pseudomonadales bacterium]